MSTGQFALQQALYTALNTDTTLATTLGAKVYDDIPQNSAYPIVQIGQDDSLDYSTKDEAGMDMTVNLHIWSRSHGSKEAKNIMDRVHTLLHDANLSVTGFNFVNLRFEFSDIIRDPDGITRHGIMRFRAVILGTTS